jgi:hypothetical protein
VLTPWKKYGHDRVYIATTGGMKLGFLNKETGEVVLEDESWRSAVMQALGAASALPTAPSPAAVALESGPTTAKPERSPAATSGPAGGSARAEHERRVARREQRIRSAHPKLGGLILALSDDPQSTRAWASGALGEERVGAKLDGLAGDGVRVLHDRRIPRSRANIDHIAVGPSGVFVIDAKRYRDAKVEVRRSGGLFSPVTQRLFVRGRDRTKLVLGLAPQVAAVYEALESCEELQHVSVQPVLAFVDALLPLFGAVEIAGVPVLGVKGTAKLVRRPGSLTTEQQELAYCALAAGLPAYQRRS